MKITIVVPAYNEEKRISGVLADLLEAKHMVVVVDDGSADKTYQVAKTFSRKNHNFVVLKHKVNLGKGEALKTGCEAAFSLGADAVVVMDSDGQHLISDLNMFLTKLKSKEFDIVFGVREFTKNMRSGRNWGNKLVAFIMKTLFGISVRDVLCGFRGFTKFGYNKIKWESAGYEVELEMIIKTAINNLRFCTVPVSTVYYENYKGVSEIDAIGIFIQIFLMKLKFSK